MSNDKTIINQENDLRAEREVSAAYQSLSKEMPPAALDECILQAARKGPVKKAALPFQRYSLAASVCLSVVVLSLYMNDELPRSQRPEMQKNIFIEQEISGQGFTDATLDKGVSAEVSRAFTPVIVSEIEEVQVEAKMEFEPAVQSIAQPAVRQIINEASSIAADNSIVTTDKLSTLADFNSAVVSEARIVVEPTVPTYRSSPASWLLAIQALLETNGNAALEEIALFTEVYPDIEVESALSELAQP